MLNNGHYYYFYNYELLPLQNVGLRGRITCFTQTALLVSNEPKMSFSHTKVEKERTPVQRGELFSPSSVEQTVYTVFPD